MVELPLEPIYEVTIVGASAQSERERERNARNAQQKMNWQNKCQRLIEVGMMCGDKPWPLADRKTVCLLYLSIGVEGRRILNCKNLHVFSVTKQLRGETVEQFYGKLKELAVNCNFKNKEEIMIRDVFITNLMDPEIQKELLKQTAEPCQALELAINMELGLRNQHQIQRRLSFRSTSTQFNSLILLEPRIVKIRIMLQDKTTIPHSTVQTVEECGFRIISINVS